MNTEQIKHTRELVEALRSGQYNQCTGYLKVDQNGEVMHCCLGVGSEIAGIENKKSDHECYDFRYPNEDHDRHNLPSDNWWEEYYGWSVFTDLTDRSAYSLNDSGVSFDTIARIIEEKFLS